MSDDPFTSVYTSLWDLVTSRQDLCDLIRVGNRIRFDSLIDRDPEKPIVVAGDVPELTIIPTTSIGNLLQTSNSSSIVRQYAFLVTTGDQRLCAGINQIEWLLFRALADWCNTITSITWNGRTFVRMVQLVSGSTLINDELKNRGIVGWSALWTVSVEMHFATKDLIDAKLVG